MKRKNIVGNRPIFPWIPTIQPIAMFRKGKRKPMLNVVQGIKTFDLIEYVAPQSNFKGNKKRCHPAQDGVEAYYTILGRTPGNVILDPFMGSGTTLIAAKELNRKAIGIEIEEKYCEIAAKRLEREARLKRKSFNLLNYEEPAKKKRRSLGLR